MFSRTNIMHPIPNKHRLAPAFAFISSRGEKDDRTAARLVLLGALATLTLVVRICPLLRPGVAWAIQPDSVGYIRLADGLTAGCGFAQSLRGKCGPAELERTPGYPLFLAFLPSLRGAVAAQAVLGTALCLLVGLFSWQQWGFLAALITEFTFGFDVPSIVAGNSILSETLFTFLLTLAVLIQLRIIRKRTVDARAVWGMLIAGFLFGLAAFVRPIGLILIVLAPAPVLFLHPLSISKRFVLSLLIVSVPIALILAWSHRNYERRSVWTFSTMSAVNLYYYRAAGVLAYSSHESFNQVQSRLLYSTGGWDGDPSQMEKFSIPILLEHPGVLGLITGKGLLRNSFSPDRTDLSRVIGYESSPVKADLDFKEKILSVLNRPLLLVLVVFQLALIIFTWIGVVLALWQIGRMRFPDAALIVVPIVVALMLLLAAAGPEGYSRFRVPAWPMLALVAAFGWTAKSRDTTPLAHEGSGRWVVERIKSGPMMGT